MLVCVYVLMPQPTVFFYFRRIVRVLWRKLIAAAKGGSMKRFVFTVTLGVLLGMALHEVPAVKQLVDKGKRKIKGIGG